MSMGRYTVETTMPQNSPNARAYCFQFEMSIAIPKVTPPIHIQSNVP